MNPALPSIPPPRRRVPRAFTLIEAIAVIVVLSIIGGAASGILASASGAYAAASNNRESTERIALAMDRIMRVLREAPETAAQDGTPDIAGAAAARLELGDGTIVELTGTDLMLTAPGSTAAVLCPEVSVFELTYLDSAGTAIDVSGAGDPSLTRTVDVRLAAGGVELRTRVFLRITGAAT